METEICYLHLITLYYFITTVPLLQSNNIMELDVFSYLGDQIFRHNFRTPKHHILLLSLVTQMGNLIIVFT
jgi:hypothetical protein